MEYQHKFLQEDALVKNHNAEKNIANAIVLDLSVLKTVIVAIVIMENQI
jgi:hypothetical protein